MALGKQIRRYRAALGLTLEQLEARTGVGVGTIAALEGRDSERSKYAARLAAGLGLSLEQLLDEAAQYPPMWCWPSPAAIWRVPPTMRPATCAFRASTPAAPWARGGTA